MPSITLASREPSAEGEGNSLLEEQLYADPPWLYTDPPPTHFVIADISSYLVIIIIMTCLNKYFIMCIIAKSSTLLLIAAFNSAEVRKVEDLR